MLAHIARQGIKVDVFAGCLKPVMAVLAGASGGLAYLNPVGRLVRSPTKAIGLDEAFQQQKPMAVALLPVLLNATADLRKKDDWPGGAPAAKVGSGNASYSR